MPGYRVIFRRFGTDTFTFCPPLAASERDNKIHNVPAHEFIVVCVVSVEDSDITPSSVSYSQCRELRTDSAAQGYVDKIVIGASAAVCGTVIFVAIFVICRHRRKGSGLDPSHLPAVADPGAHPGWADRTGPHPEGEHHRQPGVLRPYTGFLLLHVGVDSGVRSVRRASGHRLSRRRASHVWTYVERHASAASRPRPPHHAGLPALGQGGERHLPVRGRVECVRPDVVDYLRYERVGPLGHPRMRPPR